MCEFCGRVSCMLTKEQVLKRGNILEYEAGGVMQTLKTNDFEGNTYSFTGVPCYDSYSALIPDEDEDNPHLFQRYIFDEDEGTGGGWTMEEIDNPLNFQTEKEFLDKLTLSKKIVSCFPVGNIDRMTIFSALKKQDGKNMDNFIELIESKE